jgi:hypothetical protein
MWGCKIERTANFFKFIQPVLIQSYSDKFELPTKIYKTPAQVGFVLVAGKKAKALSLQYPAVKYVGLGGGHIHD